MQHLNEIETLSTEEIEEVNGGFFWIALPLILAGGYTIGKDLAIRDNERDNQ